MTWLDRPLTESESEALEDFKATIEALTAAINMLADNAEVRLPNGAYITGAALRELWGNTDFIINDGITYQSGSTLGLADMVNGQPTISFNIQALDQFNGMAGGMNWLVAHDFAHLTQWGMPFYYDQLTANNIAREILSSAGLPYYATPGFGYSTALPFGFSTPAAGDGGGGGGFGGGSGGGGDYIP